MPRAGVKFHSFLEILPPPSSSETAEGEDGEGAGEDGGYGGGEAGPPAGQDASLAAWELFEKDGVAPFVWREGRMRGYGIQSREYGKKGGVGRELVLVRHCAKAKPSFDIIENLV